MTEQRQLEYRDPRELVAYEHNSRTHTPGQIEALRRSFREYGFTNPILLKGDRVTIGAGHARTEAAIAEGLDLVPTIVLDGLTEAQWRAYVIADNQLAVTGSGWDEATLAREMEALAALDFDLSATGFDDDAIAHLLGRGPAPEPAKVLGAMAAEFMVPPFTVLSAREGWWRERKRQWLQLGIKSEVGRGDALMDTNLTTRLFPLFNRSADAIDFVKKWRAEGLDDAAIEAKAYEVQGRKRGKATSYASQDTLNGIMAQGKRKGLGATPTALGGANKDESLTTGTSVFDPVLTEIGYRWFCPPGGTVLDPFAGGSVRGIVAAALGRPYVGVDLRAEQIAANEQQWVDIGKHMPDRPAPQWHTGDSAQVLCGKLCEADMLIGCPPYGDLEVYSDDPADISAMDAAGFDAVYARIIQLACAQLRQDRFAFWVVGEYRDARGNYANLVGKTVAAFEAAGLHYYNEAVLLTAVGSLPIRAARQFRAGRKLGKTHQNVLVFVKGDGKRAAAACGDVEVAGSLAGFRPDEEGEL
jgi:hypothetical protein